MTGDILVRWFIRVFVCYLLYLLIFGQRVHSQPLRWGLITAPSSVVNPVALAPARTAAVVRRSEAQRVACGLAYSASLLHVRELTGNNDAPEIDSWARATGTALHSSWCGLYQWAVNTHCGSPTPKGAAGSYNWFKDRQRTFYVRNFRGSADSLRPADKVGFYYANLSRIGHVAMIVSAARGNRKGRAARGYIIRAGNTGRGGGRDGAGVHDYFYSASDIYAASRW